MIEYSILKETAESLIGIDALILIHKNPDADAVGSALALVCTIRQSGGTARAVCADPIPPRLAFLVGDENFTYRNGDEEGKTVLAVDVASPTQLGGLAHLADKVAVSIDHHAVSTPFAKRTLCVHKASSSGEIVSKLITVFPSADKTPQIARFLYAAISSDTGSFKYSNTSPATHEAAGELTKIINSADDGGLDTADIARLLFDTKTPAELLANALAVQKLAFSDDGRLAFITITIEDCRLAGVSIDDCSTAVDIARSVAGVCAGICIKEKGDGEYRISARSNCDFDVAKVCARFGGGGHIRAAGASLFADSSDDAESIVKSAFAEALEVQNG